MTLLLNSESRWEQGLRQVLERTRVLGLCGLFLLLILNGMPLVADNGATVFAVPATGIKIDGELSDWPELVDRQAVRSAQHFDYPSGPNDGYAFFQVTYSLAEGAIYVGFEVYDQSQAPVDQSNPEHQDRLGLFLDLRPLVDGDPGGESLNYYFHLRRDFSGWMSQVGKGWTPLVGVATMAQKDQDEVWTVEIRIQIDALSNGKASLREGGYAGLDVGFYDVDQDGSVSDILWGPGVGKYESLGYGDVFFVNPGDTLVSFKGQIQSDSSTSNLLKDFIHLQSATFPDWPRLLIVGDENGRFEKVLPTGDYDVLGTRKGTLKLRETDSASSSRMLYRSKDLRSVVPWFEGAPTKVQSSAWGQDGEWLTANLREVYPGLVVGALAVDADERLWIGTNLGLFVYDGFDYTHYKLSEAGAGFFIEQMVFDSIGQLWIIDRARGLFVFDQGKLFQFSFLSNLLLRLNDVVVSEDGDIWLAGMMGVLRFNDERFQLATSVGNYRLAAAQSIAVSSQGSLWIAGPSNRLHRFFGGILEEIDGWKQDRAIRRDSYGSLAVDRSNQVYLNAADGLVLCFQDALDSSQINKTKKAELGGSITDLAVHDGGDVWATSESVFRISHGRVIRSLREAGLLTMEIDSVVCSPNGKIWACSSFDGLARYRNSNVVRVAIDERYGLLTAGVTLDDGGLCFGTDSKGMLLVRDGETIQMTQISTDWSLTSDHITCLERGSSGGVWVGTAAGICYFSSIEGWKDWPSSANRPGQWVTSIDVSKRGETWVGTLDGAYRFDGDTWTRAWIEPREGEPSSMAVLGMMRGPNERFWVSTASGLSVLKEGEFRSVIDHSGLIADVPLQMVVNTGSDHYWVGTSRGGILRFEGDPWKGPFQQLSVDLGLTDIAVSALLLDSSQRLWVGTKNGLNRIDENSISSFGREDGLPSSRVTDLDELDDGRILITTRTGAVIYAPGEERPEVRASLLRAGGRESELNEGEIFSDQAVVIEGRSYSAATSSQQMNYCYRIVDSGGTWIHSRNSSINLGRLPVGNYQVEVVAIDRDLNASVAPAMVNFAVVHPASVWFQRIALALFGGITVPAICLAWLRGRQRNQSRAELVKRTLENNQSLIQAKKEADEARVLAEQANSAKSEFLANISHEIRTPMNAIVGFSRFLGNANLKEEKRIQMAGSIDRSSRYLLGLVNDLLDFSKIEAGKAELELEPIDLDGLVFEISEFFEPRCRKKQLDCSFESEIGERMRVRGDVTRIRQILFNLIGNAIKFTDAGKVSLRVRMLKNGQPLEASLESSSAYRIFQFRVEDSGRGIEKEDRERIFGSFNQGQLGREKGGTGLGLAIASRLAELMKGTLRVESFQGRGAVFFLEVPLEIVSTNLAMAQTIRTEHSEGLGRETSNDAELLVVDDNPDNRLLLRMLLQSLNVSVMEANDGPMALKLLADFTPGIILMDLRMPGMTGYEVFERIRGIDRLNSVPVVAVTASAFSHEQKACLDHGFDAFISKPIDADELIGTVRQFLGDVRKEKEGTPAVMGDSHSDGCELDSAVIERLQILIQQYRRTELNEMLMELQGRDDESTAFARRCQELVVAGDWPGLMRVLKKCWSADPSQEGQSCDSESSSSKV